MLRHTQRSPPRRDLDLSSPMPGSYRNVQHSFRQQLLKKHKSIDWRNFHCHCQVSSSLAAHLTVRPLSLPRSTVAFGRPDVVAAFVDKHAVAHYGMVHKPGGVIHSLVHHIRSVSVRGEGPRTFHSGKHPV